MLAKHKTVAMFEIHKTIRHASKSYPVSVQISLLLMDIWIIAFAFSIVSFQVSFASTSKEDLTETARDGSKNESKTKSDALQSLKSIPTRILEMAQSIHFMKHKKQPIVKKDKKGKYMSKMSEMVNDTWSPAPGPTSTESSKLKMEEQKEKHQSSELESESLGLESESEWPKITFVEGPKKYSSPKDEGPKKYGLPKDDGPKKYGSPKDHGPQDPSDPQVSLSYRSNFHFPHYQNQPNLSLFVHFRFSAFIFISSNIGRI